MGVSCQVVAQLPSRPQVPGILQLADAWGGGFSWTPFLSAATLMASGAAPGNFSLGDSGVGAGGLLSRSEAHHPLVASEALRLRSWSSYLREPCAHCLKASVRPAHPPLQLTSWWLSLWGKVPGCRGLLVAHSAFGEVARDPIFPQALTPPWHWSVSSRLDPAAGLHYPTSKVGHQAPPTGQAKEHLLPPPAANWGSV